MAATVTLTDKGGARVRGGMPWVYAADVARHEGDGEVCTLRDRRGALGSALWSPASPIPVRVLDRGDAPVVLDAGFFETRLRAAIARRRSDGYAEGGESAERLVHAEADALPGLVVDRYADVVVLQSTTAAIDRREPMLAELLRAVTGARLVVARDDGSAREMEGLSRRSGVLLGSGSTKVSYRDAGSLVEVDVLGDGKTGGYLDQVGNHEVAGLHARGDCLDAFSYHGGFALALARGGAASVLALDESPAATARIGVNAARNGYAQVRVETANAFDRLRALESEGRLFHTVVVDPPALAKRRGRGREGIDPALRAYKELNLRALRLLHPGGTLITCSCSARIGVSIFGEMLESAARDAGRMVQLLERRGAGVDHPVLLGVPETEYLKVFVLRVIR